ncbi:MAG: BamA/TamA family outer membrane protein [Nitrospirae bacterium]|nr:BamA/TamA family outer membrane protein [Nitrospirota bacterium]
MWLILAAVLSQVSYEGQPVGRIRVEGNRKSSSAVILREMETAPGQPFSAHRLEQDLRRLRNWQIFGEVEGAIEPDLEGGVAVTVRVKDKWSIMPVLRPSVGGGDYEIRVGARDGNFLGLHQDLGLWGGVRTGEPIAGYWFIEPRLLGTKFELNTEGAREFIVEPIYGGQEKTFIFDSDRTWNDVTLLYRFSDTLRVGPAYRVSRDRNGFNNETPFEDPAQLPDGGHTARLGAQLQLGRANFRDHVFSGGLAVLRWDYASPAWGSDFTFPWFEGKGTGYLPLGRRGTVAVRLSGGLQQFSAKQNDFTLGGFDNFRGFNSRQFRGSRYLLLNSEVRVLTWKTWRLIWLENTALLDVGGAWYAGAAEEALRDPPISAGVGMRLIPPWAYKGIVRFDLAWPLNRPQGPGIMFGVEQLL